MIRIIVALSAVTLGLAAQDVQEVTAVIRMARADGGTATRIDLVRLERQYRDLAEAMAGSLEQVATTVSGQVDGRYDAGLAEPKSRTTRRLSPSRPLPPRLHGATIYVVTVGGNGAIHGLPRGGAPKGAIILISRAERLRDCALLAPITLLTREMAQSLGIRVSRCQVEVSEDGEELEITEGDPS